MNMKSKTKVKILIPNSKESVRLPNKNRILRHYTLEWINEELKTLNDDYEVQVIELRNEKIAVDTSTDDRYHYQIKPIYCPDEVSADMKDLLAWAEMRLESSVIVLLQLTQPIRRKGMLKDALTAISYNDGGLICSYVKQPYSEAWRIIREDNWDEDIRKNKEQYLRLYDGALYVWYNFSEAYKLPQEEQDKFFTKDQQKFLGIPQLRVLYGDSFYNEGDYNSSLLWNYKKKKRFIYNYTGEVIDIDTEEDYKRFMITERDNEYRTIIKEYDSQDNEIKEINETITYNDDEKEYREYR